MDHGRSLKIALIGKEINKNNYHGELCEKASLEIMLPDCLYRRKR